MPWIILNLGKGYMERDELSQHCRIHSIEVNSKRSQQCSGRVIAKYRKCLTGMSE
jgi:hypothetical protein